MKSLAVLDASAILAVLQKEPGGEKLTAEILERSVASTVNLAEAHSKLVSRGVPPDDAWEAVSSVPREVEMLSGAQAKIAGALISKTAKAGLSLGDRCCIALAIAVNGEIFTTEKVWTGLELGPPIHLIR